MQKKKGISLIVLVITVIVMVILAGAIILTLNDSGIIQKATDAVNKTNAAAITEVAQLGWAETYAEYGADQVKLEEGVKNALSKNNINIDEYVINVTTSGVTIKAKKDMWVKEGFTVVKGDKVLKIGEIINYNAGVTSYTAGWKVLGADEDGNLLIMSAGDVTSKFLGDDTYGGNLTKAQQGWLNGPLLLDAECEPYGKGEGVVGKARSITVEDVNSVTGYDPEQNTNGLPYEDGNVDEYGNEVTYAWTSDRKISYSGTNGKSGTISYSANSFTWYDEKTGTFPSVTKGDTTTPLPTLKSTSYYYSAYELTTISPTAEESKEAYQMLFGDDDSFYWLASRCVRTYTGYVGFQLFCLVNCDVSYTELWTAGGDPTYSELGIRAVVTLSSDIQITEKTAEGWNYTVN